MIRAARSPLFAAFLCWLPVAGFVAGLELPSPPAAEARSGGSGGGFSHSSGGSRSGSRGRGSGCGLMNLSTEKLVAIVAVFVVIFVWALIKSAVDGTGTLSVGRVQLAFDATQAKGLRKAIERVVRDSDPTNSAGLFRLGQDVLDVVEKRVDALTYASFHQQDDLAPTAGQAAFNELTIAARAFYDREVVRKDASGLQETERNSKKATALTDEDGDSGRDELFVVILVMAAKEGSIGLPPKPGGREDVKAAIAAMRAVGLDRHTGFEVVWTPAAESDILGRDEALAAFPDLWPV